MGGRKQNRGVCSCLLWLTDETQKKQGFLLTLTVGVHPLSKEAGLQQTQGKWSSQGTYLSGMLSLKLSKENECQRLGGAEPFEWSAGACYQDFNFFFSAFICFIDINKQSGCVADSTVSASGLGSAGILSARALTVCPPTWDSGVLQTRKCWERSNLASMRLASEGGN